MLLDYLLRIRSKQMRKPHSVRLSGIGEARIERRRRAQKVRQCVICGRDIGGGTITCCKIAYYRGLSH
jgi:ribosomal protein L34E